MKARSPLYVVLALSVFMLAERTTAGQAVVAFGARPSHDLVVPWFADREVIKAASTLDALLAAPKPPADWQSDASFTLWQFARQLQASRLTSTQEAWVLSHLDGVERDHPDGAQAVERARFMLTQLTVGRTAPEISGTDLDGQSLQLSDYRGRVVLLVFSGEWCGICRSQYPYERLLLELYKNWPFAIVGVESGDDRAAAKVSHEAQGLSYRAWWDGGSGAAADGPIASAWNVRGWPTTYLLDGRGVIRFVDLRDEDLLKGARQLLFEQASATPASTK
jgi:peroxiredoxin